MMGKAFEYCPVCAAHLVVKTLDNRQRPACPKCDFVHYQNPVPAAGAILVEGTRILLVKRKFEPRAGLWTLPAGFVEGDEDVGTCAVRETKEETNLDIELIRLFNVYAAFDDPRTAVVLVLFLGRKIGGELQCGDDAVDAQHFELDDLPPDIAFRAHRNALADIRSEYERGSLFPSR